MSNIIQDALENKEKTVEIYSLIRNLREKLPHDEILTLFISMWEIVLIDDKIDDLHHYTRYIKFGIGRASTDSSQEIRNNHISREEAELLVRRFDGEFPKSCLLYTSPSPRDS